MRFGKTAAATTTLALLLMGPIVAHPGGAAVTSHAGSTGAAVGHPGGSTGAVQAGNGNLYGTVHDLQGESLPGATVTVTGESLREPWIVVTDANGRFRILGLPPGDYTVKTSLEGFGTVEREITIRHRRNTTIDTGLDLAFEEDVAITSESPVLDERTIDRGDPDVGDEAAGSAWTEDPWTAIHEMPGTAPGKLGLGPPASGDGFLAYRRDREDGSHSILITPDDPDAVVVNELVLQFVSNEPPPSDSWTVETLVSRTPGAGAAEEPFRMPTEDPFSISGRGTRPTGRSRGATRDDLFVDLFETTIPDVGLHAAYRLDIQPADEVPERIDVFARQGDGWWGQTLEPILIDPRPLQTSLPPGQGPPDPVVAGEDFSIRVPNDIFFPRDESKIWNAAPQVESFYVNDRWRLNDHWSFNFGVRAEDTRSIGAKSVVRADKIFEAWESGPVAPPLPPLGQAGDDWIVTFPVPQDWPGLPAGPTEISFQLVFRDVFGDPVVDVPGTIDLLIPNGNVQPGPDPYLVDCTPRTFPGQNLCVCGYFPNIGSVWGLTLDGKPIGPFSYSSRSMRLQIPADTAPGLHTIGWDMAFLNEGGIVPSGPGTLEFRVIQVGGQIDQEAILRGGSTTMRLQVFGTEEVLEMKIVNKTPEIISVEGGVNQIVPTSGGPNNVVNREVQGLQRGNFNIGWELDAAGCPCPDAFNGDGGG